MIGGPADVLCSRARVDGYRAALETAGLAVDPELIRWGTFHVEAGYEHGEALLALPDPPTAIFAGSDLQSFGVYEAARVRGIEIPGQLSVIGFDDLPMARWVGPPLTTIRQPLDRDGRHGGALRARPGRGSPRRTRDDARGAPQHPRHSMKGRRERW